jgi:thioredoxin-related protein
MKNSLYVFTYLLVLVFAGDVLAEKMDSFRIYQGDRVTTRSSVKFPDWFKHSFFDLQQDLAEARSAGKRGIIVMLSHDECSTCLAFLKTTFSDPAIIKRVTANYDVIGMNIFSNLQVIDPDGSPTVVKDFAENKSARLTPTLLFYGIENALLLKIVGFYPPEKFSHALDYIDGAHYTKVKLYQYLRDKKITTAKSENSIIRDNFIFNEPPYDLSVFKGGLVRPMLVMFETPDCSPCQRFHQRVLSFDAVRKKMSRFYAVQLDASDNTSKVTVPDGRQLTPKQWHDELNLTYDVATVFFDEHGREVLRHDGEIGRHRMAYTLDYVLDKGYRQEQQVLRWVRARAIRARAEKTTAQSSRNFAIKE